MKFALISFVIILSIMQACKRDELDIEVRDMYLREAYSKIETKEESEIIEGVQTIGKYPTHGGVRKLIELWREDISPQVEQEIIIALRQDEEFRKSSEFLDDVFNEFYKPSLSKDKLEKLERLIRASNAENKYELLRIMDERRAK